MKLRSLVAGLCLLAVALPAWGQSYIGPNYLTFDIDRALLVKDILRDRDMHVLTNSGINGQSIASMSTLKSPTPRQLPEYSRLWAVVTVTAAAVADTDSVNVEIYFAGKLSSNVSDGTDALFDSFVPPLTTFADFGSDTTATSPGYGIDGWYITRNRYNVNPFNRQPTRIVLKRQGSGTTNSAVGMFAGNGIVSSFSCLIPICDNLGRWFAAPYIETYVTNMNPTKAVFCTVDFWPKVN